MGSRGMSCSRALGIAAVLACWLVSAGGAWASSEIKMKVDPFDRAGARGVTIFDLRYVTVALYGSADFDVRTIDLDTLRLGSRDTVGARPLRHFRGRHAFHGRSGSSREARIEDVNKDGFRDMLLTFRTADIGLRAGEHVRVALQATLRDGVQIRAFDGVIRSSDPIDSCALVQSGGLVVGYRCQFTSSYEPIDWPSFLNQANAALAGTTTFQITDQTPIVLESWGGAGHDGANEDCTAANKAKGGGGVGGYARTVLTVGNLETQLGSEGDLYVEVGQSSTQNQGGGSSTVILAKPIYDIPSSDVTAPASQSIFVIAGGGGGGGKGTCVSGVGAYGGHRGGFGGLAVAMTSAAVSAAGTDASNSHAGKGGNPSGSGAGGSGDKDGKDGTSGIGGFGSDTQTLWNGSDIMPNVWTNGLGGEGGKGKGGGGGGGFGGGGGGGGSDNHKGGGGGGGSWARQSTIASDEIDGNIILGPGGETAPVAALTFQLIPLNN